MSSFRHPLDSANAAPRTIALTKLVHELIVSRERLNVDWRRQLKIGVPEMSLMGALWDQGPMSMTDARERLGLSGPTMTALADRMVAMQWVLRANDPIDRRRIMLSASEISIRAFHEVLEPLVTKLDERSSRLTDAEAVIIERYIADIRDAMREIVTGS